MFGVTGLTNDAYRCASRYRDDDVSKVQLAATAIGVDIVSSAIHDLLFSLGEDAASTRSYEIAQDKKPCSLGLFPDFEMGKVRYGRIHRVD